MSKYYEILRERNILTKKGDVSKVGTVFCGDDVHRQVGLARLLAKRYIKEVDAPEETVTKEVTGSEVTKPRRRSKALS